MGIQIVQDGVFGNRYPQLVPKSIWYAQSVYRDGVPVWTDIYPFHDNPEFEFRTMENSPWLTMAECEIVNLPERKIFYKIESRSYSRCVDAEVARKRAWTIERRESVLKASYYQPFRPFENAVGGWLPFGADVESPSYIAIELGYRQFLKSAGRFDEADLVKKVIAGGSVEVRDAKGGTYYFFDESVTRRKRRPNRISNASS